MYKPYVCYIHFHNNTKSAKVAYLPVETSQNVILEFEVASVGDRIVAFLLDILIKGAYLLVVYAAMESSGILLYDTAIEYLFMLILIAPVAFYDLVFELMWNGQSIGKHVLNIKVVKMDGDQAGLGEYFIRWLLRFIEIGPLGIISLISILASKYAQRLGDLAAGTTVIKLVKRDKISDTILENVDHEYAPTYPQVQKLTDRDANIIKDTIRKSRQDPETMRLLAEKIETVLDIESDIAPKQFLDVILKDFNYYTGKIRSAFDKK